MAQISLMDKMETMKISVTADKKLQDALDAVQKLSKTRTVTVQDIRNTLDRIPVLKAHLDGTTVYWDGAEQFPGAYRYTPMSTHWTAQNIKGRWYITDICRAECPNRSSFRGLVEYSEDAKKWIIDHASMLQ